MLKQILILLQEADGEVSIPLLSRRLGASPAAVEGMLRTLQHKGRIVEIGADCGVCGDCALASHCGLPANRGRRFRLAG